MTLVAQINTSREQVHCEKNKTFRVKEKYHSSSPPQKKHIVGSANETSTLQNQCTFNIRDDSIVALSEARRLP